MKRLFAILLMCTAINSHAEGMKDLLLDALKDGSSEGLMTDNMDGVFKNATKSDEPVYVKAKRIEQFEQGCGRLHIEFKQTDVVDNQGKKVTIDPWLEMNICPDGSPPQEKIKEMKLQQQKILSNCTISVDKGKQDKDTGATSGVIKGRACPKNGMTHWRYTGECDALRMPDNISTNTQIEKNGTFKIELKIPMQCLEKNNEWQALLKNERGLAIGNLVAQWTK